MPVMGRLGTEGIAMDLDASVDYPVRPKLTLTAEG